MCPTCPFRCPSEMKDSRLINVYDFNQGSVPDDWTPGKCHEHASRNCIGHHNHTSAKKRRGDADIMTVDDTSGVPQVMTVYA